MERRNFIKAAGLIGVSPLLVESFIGELEAKGKNKEINTFYNLNGAYTPKALDKAYKPEKQVTAAEAPPAVLPPHVFLYYDKDKNTFVNPTKVEPTLNAGKYRLDAGLHAFNVATANYDNFRRYKNELQLGLNVAADIQGGQDSLTWVFMNAIDVFLQKPANVPQQLSTFKNYQPTANLKPSSQIVIPEGILNLQVSALGQPRDGFWHKLFTFASKILNSPLFATFAIPTLVKESVDFVSKTMDVIATQDKLQEVWKTNPISFAIQRNKDADFYMRKGYWITIDREFASSHDYLSHDFAIDLEGQSFQLVQGGQPVDANYLVTSLNFTAVAG